MKTITLLITLAVFTAPLFGQKTAAEILEKPWTANWITTPDHSATEYGVYLFRKTLELPAVPDHYIVHVSADNRYQLFVNGQMVSFGPARGDLNHWNFETVDLKPHLRQGKNILAARVWNEAGWRPEVQITAMTGFILQGNTSVEESVNTGVSWKCIRDESYAPLKLNVPFYYVSGPGEIRDFSRHPRGWEGAGFDDSAWPVARTLFKGLPKDVLGPYGTTNVWMLRPSGIPPMELKPERIPRGTATGLTLPAGFPEKEQEVIIPAGTSISILLDQTYLTNAYPVLEFSKGKDARIAMGYAEALYSEGYKKGNRNETEGKRLIGRTDSLISAGSDHQVFSPLSYRTYRYLELRITTAVESLVLNDIYSIFTGYPFRMNAGFRSDNPELNTILDIGWRTARLCATETYMDCPYYEQLQYIGDARIQALVSLYNSGDDRLVKNALNYMDYSRQPEGVTLSRHPSYTPQYIPTFSLWYIGMLHDYLRYGQDPEFVRNKLDGVYAILNYFEKYQGADGSLRKVPQWRFTDWVNDRDWNAGEGPVGRDGASAMLDLQLLWAYQTAGQLEADLGINRYSGKYREQAQKLKAAILKKYWDAGKGLFADREEKDLFSQHTNALAILTGVADQQKIPGMVEHLLNNKELSQASIYFKYYLHQALIRAGRGNDYSAMLDKWRENISMGLTTWAEMSDVDGSRSDCHAWGASPNIEFYRTLLGIDSDAPGFSKVKITPHLGYLKSAAGHIPHPKGTVAVSYQQVKDGWEVEIDLPAGVSGNLVWKGMTKSLKAGKNRLIMN